MVRIENVKVHGFEAAVRGARNPMNSWGLSDSKLCLGAGFVDCTQTVANGCPRGDDESFSDDVFCIGEADMKLLMRLVKAGTDHSKFMRFIDVTADIIAPEYFWKEEATYKVGTVENSTSTMHKIHAKEFTLDDFSHDHLGSVEVADGMSCDFMDDLERTINRLNRARDAYFYALNKPMKEEAKRAENVKRAWWQIIQNLPMSYNYRRTVHFNYQVLRNMYHARRLHKLDEWRDICRWIETLPYSELITTKGTQQ